MFWGHIHKANKGQKEKKWPKIKSFSEWDHIGFQKDKLKFENYFPCNMVKYSFILNKCRFIIKVKTVKHCTVKKPKYLLYSNQEKYKKKKH